MNPILVRAFIQLLLPTAAAGVGFVLSTPPEFKLVIGTIYACYLGLHNLLDEKLNVQPR